MMRNLFAVFLTLLAGCAGGESQQMGGTEVGNPPTVPGSGAASSFSMISLSVQQSWEDGFHIADLNGDGKKDILVSGSPQVLLGDGTGGFVAGVNFESAAFYSIQSADLNGDKKLDLIYKQYASSSIAVRFGNGDGTFSAKINLQDTSPAYKFGIVRIADMNNDGALDIVSLNYENLDTSIKDAIYVRLNNGSGSFSNPISYVLPYYSLARDFQILDLNDDGRLDVLVQNSIAGGTMAIFGDGFGRLQNANSLTSGGYSLLVGDFDRDGKFDYLSHFADEVAIAYGSGNGDFSESSALNLEVGRFDHSMTGERPALVDLDNDGSSDLITTDNAEGSISIHKGFADGSFKTVRKFPGTPNARIVEGADLDGNGMPDIIVKSGQRHSDTNYYPIIIFLNPLSK